MGKKILMKGNEAIGEAAILAGCTHYFGYPITPQNEIPAYMSRRLPQVGGTFLQAESEIAAINMVMGASAAGARVMTSTSSPGMALKQEGISYLSGAQLPAVVVNMMRGPGLGNIAGAQGDYFQATRGGGNGDYRTFVFGPGNVQELADYTMKAFELADKYKMVALILGDGFLGQMAEGFILPEKVEKLPSKDDWALSGAKGRDPRTIASLRLNPDNYLEQHNLNLQKTYDEISEKETVYDTYMIDDAEVLIVSYGTSSRVCRKAIRMLRESGIKAGMFRPITLWPFPYKELIDASKGMKKVLAVEMSLGQMVEDVYMSAGKFTDVDFYGRAGGMLPKVETIIEKVKSYV